LHVLRAFNERSGDATPKGIGITDHAPVDSIANAFRGVAVDAQFWDDTRASERGKGTLTTDALRRALDTLRERDGRFRAPCAHADSLIKDYHHMRVTRWYVTRAFEYGVCMLVQGQAAAVYTSAILAALSPLPCRRLDQCADLLIESLRNLARHIGDVTHVRVNLC
jgi:hypothetical protein